MRGVFVTGTGTGVGKTVVAAAIARTLVAAGKRVAVFKPAVTGLDEVGATGDEVGGAGEEADQDELLRHAAEGSPGNEADHELLRRAAGSRQSDGEIAPYRYGPPMSPHLAAALAGEEIEPGRLLTTARAAGAGADFLVAEGVGGLLVPLCMSAGGRTTGGGGATGGEERERSAYLVRDLAVDLGLPLVVAASPGLGTISHTLLTVEAARAVGLDVASVVLTPWPAQPGRVERSNRETIAALADLPVETLPHLDLGDAAGWPAAGPLNPRAPD